MTLAKDIRIDSFSMLTKRRRNCQNLREAVRIRLGVQENRLKAERAWFLDRRERRAKPETEPLLTRRGKSGVFSRHPA
jgi:hypothetical protein